MPHRRPAPLSSWQGAFFGWLHWTEQLVAVSALRSIVRRSNALAWATWSRRGWPVSSRSLPSIRVANYTPAQVHAPDHSLGAFGALLGYLVIAVASGRLALDTEGSLFTRGPSTAFAWRPGLPLIGVGAVAALLAMTTTTWFSPQHYDTNFHNTGTLLAATSNPGTTNA